jgi:hypothetical protein
VNGTEARLDMLAPNDPLVNLVRHRVDPRAGAFESEYRPDDSVAATAFRTRVTWARFLEYHDTNQDQRYENGTDTIIRSWPLSAYAWTTTGWRAVFVGGQTAQDLSFTGTASGAPRLKIELAAAGAAVTDEGAKARAQDVLLYVDMSGFPSRGAGDLYALEGTVAPPPGADVSLDAILDPNGTVPLAVLARSAAGDRLAFFDWGGQATLDGSVQDLNASLDPPSDASGTRTVRWDFPLFDKTLHMVMVSGVEYTLPDKRAPDVALPVAMLAVGALAWARRR